MTNYGTLDPLIGTGKEVNVTYPIFVYHLNRLFGTPASIASEAEVVVGAQVQTA